ncbi:MAG: hypothetical protein R3Y22_07860 [Bacteroidales bacterium]
MTIRKSKKISHEDNLYELMNQIIIDYIKNIESDLKELKPSERIKTIIDILKLIQTSANSSNRKDKSPQIKELDKNINELIRKSHDNK